MKMKVNKVHADQVVYVLRNAYRPSVGITYDVRHNSEFTPGGASIIAVLAVAGSTVTIVSRTQSEQMLKDLAADITKAARTHSAASNELHDYVAAQTGKVMELSTESVQESAQLVLTRDAQVISACVKSIGNVAEMRVVIAASNVLPEDLLRYEEVTLSENDLAAARYRLNKRRHGSAAARRMQRGPYSLNS
jgi:hypothetical protein